MVGWKRFEFRPTGKEHVYVFDVAAGTVLREFQMVLHARHKLGGLAGAVAAGGLRMSPEGGHPSGVIGFLDDDRLAVEAVEPARAVRVYSVATGELTAEFLLPPPAKWGFDQGRAYALSPGRRYLAVWDGPAVRVFRTDTGAAVGQLPVFVPPTAKEGMPMRIAGLAFSPDGATLAAVAAFGRHPQDYTPRDARVYAWDLRTGREAVYAPLSGLTGDYPQRAGLEWAADGSAWLVEDTLVVDPKSGKTVWRLPPHAYSSRVRMPISADRVWEIDPADRGRRARVRTLPADQLAAARAGGEALDAGYPPAVAVPDPRLGPRAARAAVWSTAIDPAAGPVAEKPVELPNRPGLRLESVRVAGGPRDGGALVEWARHPGADRRPAADEAGPRLLERFDPATGAAAGRVEVPGICRVVHAGPDADLAVTTDAGPGDRVDVWSVAGGKHVAGWRPYAAFPPAEQRGLPPHGPRRLTPGRSWPSARTGPRPCASGGRPRRPSSAGTWRPVGWSAGRRP